MRASNHWDFHAEFPRTNMADILHPTSYVSPSEITFSSKYALVRSRIVPLSKAARQWFKPLDKIGITRTRPANRILEIVSGSMQMDAPWLEEDDSGRFIFYRDPYQPQIADMRLVPSRDEGIFPFYRRWRNTTSKAKTREKGLIQWRRGKLAAALEKEEQFPPLPRDCSCFLLPALKDPRLCDICQPWADPVHLL